MRKVTTHCRNCGTLKVGLNNRGYRYCKKCANESSKRFADNKGKPTAFYHSKSRFGSVETVEAVLLRDNYSCVGCGMSNEEHKKLWNKRLTIDHIDGNGRDKRFEIYKLRTKESINNNLTNLQTLCLRCHGSKDGKRALGIKKNRVGNPCLRLTKRK